MKGHGHGLSMIEKRTAAERGRHSTPEFKKSFIWGSGSDGAEEVWRKKIFQKKFFPYRSILEVAFSSVFNSSWRTRKKMAFFTRKRIIIEEKMNLKTSKKPNSNWISYLLVNLLWISPSWWKVFTGFSLRLEPVAQWHWSQNLNMNMWMKKIFSLIRKIFILVIILIKY